MTLTPEQLAEFDQRSQAWKTNPWEIVDERSRQFINEAYRDVPILLREIYRLRSQRDELAASLDEYAQKHGRHSMYCEMLPGDPCMCGWELICNARAALAKVKP